jgi:hypothetical protein
MYLLHGLYSTQQILTRASINRAELRFSTIDARNKLQIYSAHTFISYLSLFLGSRLASLLTSKTNQPNAWTRQGRLWLAGLAKLYIAGHVFSPLVRVWLLSSASLTLRIFLLRSRPATPAGVSRADQGGGGGVFLQPGFSCFFF